MKTLFMTEPFLPIYDFDALEAEPDPIPEEPCYVIILHPDQFADLLRPPFPVAPPKPTIPFSDKLHAFYKEFRAVPLRNGWLSKDNSYFVPFMELAKSCQAVHDWYDNHFTHIAIDIKAQK